MATDNRPDFSFDGDVLGDEWHCFMKYEQGAPRPESPVVHKPRRMSAANWEAWRKLSMVTKCIHDDIESFLAEHEDPRPSPQRPDQGPAMSSATVPCRSTSNSAGSEDARVAVSDADLHKALSIDWLPFEEPHAAAPRGATAAPDPLEEMMRSLVRPEAPRPVASERCESPATTGVGNFPGWRKYGKKPRSKQYGKGIECGTDEVWRHYYHCSQKGCKARKIYDENVTNPAMSCTSLSGQHTCNRKRCIQEDQGFEMAAKRSRTQANDLSDLLP